MQLAFNAMHMDVFVVGSKNAMAVRPSTHKSNGLFERQL